MERSGTKPPLEPPLRRGARSRLVLARIEIGHDELVITLDGERVDVRVHTPTGGLRFPSKNGLTININDVPKLIGALQAARKEIA